MGKGDISELTRSSGCEATLTLLHGQIEKARANGSSSRDGGPDCPLSEKLLSAILNANKLAELSIVPRHKLLGDWFREGDLGFVFAPRGVGKTWFALSLAGAIATGKPLGPWKAETPLPVLYIDGEMPLELIQSRVKGLGLSSENLRFLSHEVLFDGCGSTLNLARPEGQLAVSECCEKLGIKVLVLDNLSVLFGGMKENEADAWEMVLSWLMDLRRKKIAVIIIHHAGRGGREMRGTSRREDVAFWIIRLEEKPDITECRAGARFISVFTKQRNTPGEVPAYEWSIQPVEGTDQIRISFKEAASADIVLELIRDGLESCEDIAHETGLSKGQVSKIATKLTAERKVKKEGRRYLAMGGDT
jgi:hypothetical protein